MVLKQADRVWVCAVFFEAGFKTGELPRAANTGETPATARAPTAEGDHQAPLKGFFSLLT